MAKLGDLAEFGKNATQIMIFLPHYMWAENNKGAGSLSLFTRCLPLKHFHALRGNEINLRNRAQIFENSCGSKYRCPKISRATNSTFGFSTNLFGSSPNRVDCF